jgi:hypothetical protein
MPDIEVQRAQFSVDIHCPKCKRAGKAIWEEAATPNPRGLKPSLVNLPDGFVQRMRRNLANVPEVICKDCGVAVPD